MVGFFDKGLITPEESLKVERLALESDECQLIIYSRNAPTVSLGSFNDVNEYVDVAYARSNNVAIIRRISGGSAVYTDQDQIIFTYSSDRGRFKDKTGSYESLCNALIGTLSVLGIRADYKPVNDVLVNGRKISGCAQYRDRDRILHHGTLILRLDSTTMDKVLRPVKGRSYGGLTSVEEALGYVPERKRIAEAFKEGFRDLI